MAERVILSDEDKKEFVKEFDEVNYFYLYVIRDRITKSFSNIMNCSNDIQAYDYFLNNISEAKKRNPSLVEDDFELLYLGRQVKSTAVIEPDYRLVDSDTFASFRENLSDFRKREVERIRKELGKE